MCHDIASGKKWIDFSDGAGRFQGTDWVESPSWCNHASARLYIGDFNGDGLDDMLCHDVDDGRHWIEYATSSGDDPFFVGNDWNNGTRSWCKGARRELFVGDFNGDGRDDVMCFDHIDGHKWVDFANSTGRLWGSNYSFPGNNWCTFNGERLSVGDFNDDGRDDLLCHSVQSGYKWVDYADSNNSALFQGTDDTFAWNWCGHDAGELH